MLVDNPPAADEEALLKDIYQQFTCQYCGIPIPWNHIRDHETFLCQQRPSPPSTNSPHPNHNPLLPQFPFTNQSFVDDIPQTNYYGASSTATTHTPPSDSFLTTTSNRFSRYPQAVTHPTSSDRLMEAINNDGSEPVPITQDNDNDEQRQQASIHILPGNKAAMKRIFQEFTAFKTDPKQNNLNSQPLNKGDSINNFPSHLMPPFKPSPQSKSTIFRPPNVVAENSRPSCVYCGLIFNSGSRVMSAVRILQHEEMCLDNPTNMCRMCGQRFGGSHLELTVEDIRIRLYRHIQICERNPYSRLQCPYCQATFKSTLSCSSYDRLKQHLSVNCEIATKLRCHCKLCGEFMDYGVLETPKTKFHSLHCSKARENYHHRRHCHSSSAQWKFKKECSNNIEEDANEIIDHLEARLQQISNREELRKALRELQLKWHPDRQQPLLGRTSDDDLYSTELANRVFLYVQHQWERSFRRY